MRKIFIIAAILTLTSGAYAGPAVVELGSAAGTDAVKAAVQAPPAPTDVNGSGFQKSADDTSVEVGDELFDPGLAKANCHANPGAPGCPLFCKDHHAYPGCPMYCQLNPLSPVCGHVPAYCGTNPNGYNCPKSAEKKSASEESFDEGLAKANCTTNPAAPGCPLFCKDHHAYPGCPMYCQLNPLSPACRKEAPVTKSNCEYNPSEPGCSAYCASPGMQMQPGCPMYCSSYPSAPECQKSINTKAETGNADETADAKKVTPGYPKPPHPQYCQHHHGLPGCR